MHSSKIAMKYRETSKLSSLPLGGSRPSYPSSFQGKSRSKRREKLKIISFWPLIPVALFLFVIRWHFQTKEKASIPTFVKFNCYRLGGREFSAIGLAPLDYHWRTKFHGCHWVENGAGHRDRPIAGKLKAYFPGEHHNLKFESLILNCLLQYRTSDKRGGKLYVNIDHKDVLVYHEQPNAYPISLDPKPPFKHHVAFCSPPIHSAVDAKRLYEWLEYHFYLGLDYVIIYDAGGITEEVLQTLLPYEQLGLLEVRDVGSSLDYESWLYGQVMLINDCAYSTRYTARWTLYLDFDEFFNSDNPPPPEIKKARIEAKQEELHAQEHWHRQVGRMQQRHHKEKIGENGGGRRGLGVYNESNLIPHEKRYSLEERQRREKTEEEEKRAEMVQLRQQKQYQRLKKQRNTANGKPWEKKLSPAQQKEVLSLRLKEQEKQTELLRAHREHLERHKQKEKLLPTIFDAYDGASYISFGTMWWDVERCLPEREAQGSWAIQRMLYHWPHIYCTKLESFPRAESCLDYHGHRKYAVDPRKVTALQIHRPEINDTFGYDLDTTIAKMNHFQGIINLRTNTCTTIVSLDDELIWWARGQELSNIAVLAQKQPTAKFAGFHFPDDDFGPN